MTDDQKRRINDHRPAVGLEWDDTKTQPRALIARPEQWTILLTSGNHGLVGAYGHDFPHADGDHERLNVVDEAVVIKLRERVQQLEAAVPPVSAAEQPSVLTEAIMSNLLDRHDVLDGIDDDIMDEIRAEMRDTIAAHLARQSPAPEPAAYVNGDELDNMLDNRTATIQTAPSGWRRTPLYRAPVAQEGAQPDEVREVLQYLVKAADWWEQNQDSPKSALSHFVVAANYAREAIKTTASASNEQGGA